jgi:hypothetical protein
MATQGKKKQRRKLVRRAGALVAEMVRAARRLVELDDELRDLNGEERHEHEDRDAGEEGGQ